MARGKTPLGKPVSVGVTDTDDAIDEVKAGKPVRIVFPDRAGGKGRMGTLFIPNTLCIPKGCPNPEGAKKLVDYLLSAEVEKRLAEGPSAQIPLNPKVTAKLPPQIETPAKPSRSCASIGARRRRLLGRRSDVRNEPFRRMTFMNIDLSAYKSRIAAFPPLLGASPPSPRTASARPLHRGVRDAPQALALRLRATA